MRAPTGGMELLCAGCGNSMTADDKFCRVCGRVASADSAVTPRFAAPAGGSKTSGKAVVSLICGLFFFLLPASIVAIVFGHLSLSETRKSAGRLKGEGLAIAGLVLGYAGLAVLPVLIIAAIAIPNLLRARMAANEASAVASLRTFTMAEVGHATSHPGEGYPCSLSDLSAAPANLGSLATGQNSGYLFELTGCSAGPDGGANVRYQVVAYPLRVNQTGVRAFCSSESRVIKVDSSGSARGCLENGSALE
jgi:type IV pilus assembly protein PilA